MFTDDKKWNDMLVINFIRKRLSVKKYIKRQTSFLVYKLFISYFIHYLKPSLTPRAVARTLIGGGGGGEGVYSYIRVMLD